MNARDLAEIEARFDDGFGCPQSLRDLSYAPWVLRLQRDARALLEEVKRIRARKAA